MTATQLDGLVTLLRSRAVPRTTTSRNRAPASKAAVFLGGAPDAKCEKVDAGGVPSEWVMAPGCDTGRAILYLHGGGYAIGSLNTHRRLAYDISAASAAKVLLIDYRLAPEHPFAAIDDAPPHGAGCCSRASPPTGWRSPAIRRRRAHHRHAGRICATRSSACRPAPSRSRRGSIWKASATASRRGRQDPMVQKDGLLWMAKMYLNGKDAKTPLPRRCMPT